METNEDTPQGAPDARARMAQARRKTEFILSRAWGLLRDPKTEWEQIRLEETSAAALMLGYVAPLAAVPALMGLVGALTFGGGLIGAPAQLVVGAVVSFLVFVALIYFIGLLTNAIADNFEAKRDEIAALKLAAYAATPTFLLGLFAVAPALWWAPLIGLALSAYLLHRGLAPLMRCPPERALAYAATIIVAGLVALVAMGLLTSCLTSARL